VYNFHLDFVDVKVGCAGNYFRKETIEKTILRLPCASEFSHSLGQKLTLDWSAPLMVDSFRRRF